MSSSRNSAASARAAKVFGGVGRAMITAGVVVLLFVVFQLWGTDIQESRSQAELRGALEERFTAAAQVHDDPVEPAVAEPPATGVQRAVNTPTTTAGSESPVAPPSDQDDPLVALLVPEPGEALARIEIPTIDVDKVVVDGVAVSALRKGPGHYSQTPLPGNGGNASIAGHRTTYGSPFNRIDELAPGDEIVVTTVQGEFRYRVLDPASAFPDHGDQIDSLGDGHAIVHPSSSWVLGDFGDDRLTLTVCHPKLSSRQRIIVAAVLIDDTVEAPAWARPALDARLPTEPAVDASAATANTITTEPVPLAVVPLDAEAGATQPDLDEGLGGERGAIPGAAIWMIAAGVLWFGGGWVGRHLGTTRGHRISARLTGLTPAVVCLWFAFELIDRALPAG